MKFLNGGEMQREFDWRIEIETFGFHEEGAIKRRWPGKIDEKREKVEERERESLTMTLLGT